MIRRLGLLLPLALLSCYRGEGWRAEDLAIVVAEEGAVRWAAEDLARLIGEATGVTPPIVANVEDTDRLHPMLVGEGPWTCPALADGAYYVSPVAFGGRSALRFCGGGVLGRQYAVYEWLHALGVRFVHPE